MKKLVTFILGLAASSLIASSPALASASEWVEAEGGRVRLVTVGMPDADGRLRALLDIRLAPGWKTYWREPGDAGVPPTLEIVSGGSAEMHFPAPEWHHDGTADWAGYEESVALPVTLTLPKDRGPILEATAFLGLCQTICVPLKADLVVNMEADPDDTGDALALAAAELQLPEPSSYTFGISTVVVEDGFARFTVTGPTSVDAELFLAGNGELAFSRPEPQIVKGELVFVSHIVSYLKPPQTSAKVQFTLKTPEQSVSGTVEVGIGD